MTEVAASKLHERKFKFIVSWYILDLIKYEINNHFILNKIYHMRDHDGPNIDGIQQTIIIWVKIK